MKVVRQTEIDDGEESKNFLCAFFKAGMCEKGDDCEFSHDLNVEYNQGQVDIYTDLSKVKHNMANEINKIAGEKEKKRTGQIESTIVCKYFLDAVQKKVYGFKWDCPNGDQCHYRHYLPKGFVITSSRDKMQEEMTIEEYYDFEENIDAERDRISREGKQVNDVTFAEWKKKRDLYRQENKDDNEKRRKFKTGIQLFRNQAELFKDDENAQEGEIEREENDIIEDTTMNNTMNSKNELRTEKEILEELDSDMKGIKINAELFKDDENLDDLNDLGDDEEGEEKKEEEEVPQGNIEEEEKENDNGH